MPSPLSVSSRAAVTARDLTNVDSVTQFSVDLSAHERSLTPFGMTPGLFEKRGAHVLPFSLYLQSPPHRLIIATHVGNLYRFRPLLTTIQGFEIMMRVLASSLFRWLTVAVYGSNHSRPGEVEFPAASPRHCGAGSLFEGPFRGQRAAGCASIDALCPFNNWVNLEDQYEISFIRETLAPFARRVPTVGRSPALSRNARGESSQENILAEGRRIFWQRRKRKETRARFAQWLTPAAAGAQA